MLRGATEYRTRKTVNTKLSSWVQAHGPGAITVLARKASIRLQTVSDIVSGKTKCPHRDTAVALSEATGGEVSAASILGLHEETVTAPTAPGECA